MSPRNYKIHSKIYTLSTGYKVKANQEDTEDHLRNAILGECLVEVQKIVHNLDLDHFNDQLVRRIYQECEYLSLRYGLVLWRLMGAMMDRLGQAMEDLRDSLCEECNDKNTCENRGQLLPPCKIKESNPLN